MATGRGNLKRENCLIEKPAVSTNSIMPGTNHSHIKNRHVNGFKKNGINGKNGKHEQVSFSSPCVRNKHLFEQVVSIPSFHYTSIVSDGETEAWK